MGWVVVMLLARGLAGPSGRLVGGGLAGGRVVGGRVGLAGSLPPLPSTPPPQIGNVKWAWDARTINQVSGHEGPLSLGPSHRTSIVALRMTPTGPPISLICIGYLSRD